MAGRLRKPPVMGGFFQRRENEVEIDNKINLGFSGGGFRATFYCLGAYRRLVELGLEKTCQRNNLCVRRQYCGRCCHQRFGRR